MVTENSKLNNYDTLMNIIYNMIDIMWRIQFI